MARPPPKMGRPTKLDDVAAEKIVNAIRSGAFRKTAAIFAGVSERTMREWMAAGKEDPDSEWGTFRRRVVEASAKAEVAVGLTAYKAAVKDPKYALQYLAIRWRTRWNTKHQVTVSGDAKNPIRVVPYDLSKVSDDDLDRLEEIAKRAAAAPVDGDSGGEGET